MHPVTDVLATLGGRFNVIPDPHDRCVCLNSWGEFRERTADLTVGIKAEGRRAWSLPFTGKGRLFPYVEQDITMTGISYKAVLPEEGLEFSARFTAPFYPQDEKVSLAPVIYADITVTAMDHPYRWTPMRHPVRKGTLVFGLAGKGMKSSAAGNDLVVTYGERGFNRYTRGASEADSSVSRFKKHTVRHRISGKGFRFKKGLLEIPFNLSRKKVFNASLEWCSYTPDPVLEVSGKPQPFRYTRYFGSETELLRWARKRKDAVFKKCDFFDRQITGWSLGRGYSAMTAFAFHSFLMNTWWTGTGRTGDWFSVWEGSCYYHSTIDVEYNNAMVYFALWPQLLGKLLHQWMDYTRDGEPTAGPAGAKTLFLCHDMGSGVQVGDQHYSHNMEVEENCNYLLLLHAYWRQTGDDSHIRKYRGTLDKLARFIIACDSQGNGIPDRGTANTIDDASAAVQFGKNQVYLGVKAAAALQMYAEMADLVKDTAAARKAAKQAEKIVSTVDRKAWLTDHYAVTLERTTGGLIDPWSGKALPAGELSGWNAYSIYTANGLLYPLMAGRILPFKQGRLAEDIVNAADRTMTTYGSAHSSDNTIVWISQNHWRDFTVSYLGHDMLNNNDRYWEYQLTTGNNHKGSCFYETGYRNNLCFYPRGITCLGVVFAATGMVLDRAGKQVRFNPLRPGLRVPLLPLADWKKMTVPELVSGNKNGSIAWKINGKQSITGVRVTRGTPVL